MSIHNDAMWSGQEIVARDAEKKRRAFRPRRPTSVWGWLLWLLAAVLFYFLISYVLVHWWSTPIPADAPVTPPSSNMRSS